MSHRLVGRGLLTAAVGAAPLRAGTAALWLFDEQEQIYPGSGLNDTGPGDLILSLGRGGEIVPGHFGHALRITAPSEFKPLFDPDAITFKVLTQDRLVRTGLEQLALRSGRTIEPLSWLNATFAAAFLSGEEHLRHTSAANATASRLNLGAGDWTRAGGAYCPAGGAHAQ